MEGVEVYGGKNEDDKVMMPDHLLQEIDQNWLQVLLAIKEEQKKKRAQTKYWKQDINTLKRVVSDGEDFFNKVRDSQPVMLKLE